MTVPVWLAAVISAAMITQLLAGIAWAIRSDRERALQGAQLSRLLALLERHDPTVLRGDIDQLRRDVEGLVAGRVTDHRLLRHLQRRIDRHNIPDLAAEHTGVGDET